MIDYTSPIQAGKPIVVGQAAILWGDAFIHPDKGAIPGGWILPGCVRTTNSQHAESVCRRLNDAIKSSALMQPTVKFMEQSEESIGELIARKLKEIR